MKLYYPLILLVSFSVLADPDIKKEAIKYVPAGTLEVAERDEAKVRTAQGTIVEIELNRDGSLDEASGELAQKDTLTPGQGLLSLTEAVAAMKKHGKNVEGEWSLDKDFLRDWEYEFEGMENGKEHEYSLNDKTGKLIESKPD